MGTSSSTIVKSDGKILVNMNRQSDGYLSGHGEELFNFLDGMEVVNGLSFGKRNVFNGPGCLAASLVAYFKEGPGGIYLNPGEEEPYTNDYTYIIDVERRETSDGEIEFGQPLLSVYEWNSAIGKDMTVEEFGVFVKTERE